MMTSWSIFIMTKPSNKRNKRKKGGSNSDVDLDSSAISNEDHKPENRCAQEQMTSKDAEGHVPADVEKFAKHLIEQFVKILKSILRNLTNTLLNALKLALQTLLKS